LIKVIAFDVFGVLIDGNDSPRNIDSVLAAAENFKDAKLVIASNSGGSIKHWVDANMPPGLFDAVYASALMGCWKPQPEFYKRILDDYGIRPDQMLFIDDSPENVAAAQRLGIRAIRHTRDADLKKRILSYA